MKPFQSANRILIFLTSFTLIFSSSVIAEETGGIARVLLASPSTTFEGKKILDNELLKTVGALKTGKEGGAKLKLVANEVMIEISANSEIKLILSPNGDANESIELIRGRARLRVPPRVKEKGETVSDKGGKPSFLLRHRKVTMGVRGTDFLAIANEDLGETELVVFSGDVDFMPPGAKTNVRPGHWMGIGGRFGAKPRGPLKLAAEGVRYFETGGDIPGFAVDKTPEAAHSAAPAQ